MIDLLIYIILFINYQSIDSEPNWKFEKEKDGISIYTTEVENSSFIAFKAIVQVKNHSLEQVLEILMDVDRYAELYPDCIDPKMLEQKDVYHNVYRIIATAPWPLKDREAIYEQIGTFDEEKQTASIRLIAQPDYLPRNKKSIRIEEGRGYWLLKKNDNVVQVSYQFHGEPGGNIPAWLANQFVVSHPIKTLQNLQNRLQEAPR
jgi:hypothetical protein